MRSPGSERTCSSARCAESNGRLRLEALDGRDARLPEPVTRAARARDRPAREGSADERSDGDHPEPLRCRLRVQRVRDRHRPERQVQRGSPVPSPRMRDLGWWPVVLVALALGAAVLAVGYRRGRLARTALLAAGTSLVVWAVAVGVMLTGWNDIDGWIDCQDCHGWHELGALLFWTPLVVAASLLAAAAITGVAQRAAPHSR